MSDTSDTTDTTDTDQWTTDRTPVDATEGDDVPGGAHRQKNDAPTADDVTDAGQDPAANA